MAPVDLVTPIVMMSAGLSVLVVVLRRRRSQRLRAVEQTLGCPRTGGAVRCELLIDEESGDYVAATRCSRCGPGRPQCEQACVQLLNLGIPLRSSEPDALANDPSGPGDG